MTQIYDVAVIGGGPAGATAACDLARAGHSVVLLDRAGRIKPCGGAIPPRLIRDFLIPDHLLVATITGARMVAPSAKEVDIPIEGGFVGMVDRDVFDEWLRARAAETGAERVTGTFENLERDDQGRLTIHYAPPSHGGAAEKASLKARFVIGADGANSAVARQAMPQNGRAPFVFAYHEIIAAPDDSAHYDAGRCDIYYRGQWSPDFYSWVFPHGKTASVGVGSAQKGFALRGAVEALRRDIGIDQALTLRREGAPIPLKPLKKWDNGRDVVLAGDAAGVVAPASGEGIYYAMVGGRLAADGVLRALATGRASELSQVRRQFMREHGLVFWVLGIMQYYWYGNDKRRERFVRICADRDVQRLTFDSYMNKKLVRRDPIAHVRIFFKDLAHLTGLAPL